MEVESEEGILKTLGLLEEMLLAAEQRGFETARARLVTQILTVRGRLDALRSAKTIVLP